MHNVFLLALAVINFVVDFSEPPTSYKIDQRISIPGNGKWDYLTCDDINNRLFISHDSVVQVLDLNTKKIISTIENLRGVHGIALAYDYNKGFISCGKDSSVIVFDLKTCEKKAKIHLDAAGPDAIIYDPFSINVFVFNAHSNSLSVINAFSNLVSNTISLDGKPEFAVSNNRGKIYANIEDKNEVCVIDVKSMKVEQYWSIAPAEEPSGLAIDTITQRLFSVCDHSLTVLDAENGKVVTVLPIGDKVDGVVYDAQLKRIYSSNGDGTMTVIEEEDGNHFKVLENFSTQVGARTIALNKITHHIFLPTASFKSEDENDKAKPHARPKIIPDSFVVLDIRPK